MSWIDSFLTTSAGKYMVKVPNEFIISHAPLPQIKSQISNFDTALNFVLKSAAEVESQKPSVQENVMKLYGLVHAQYLLTEEGQVEMIKKFNAFQFPECPRYHCHPYRTFPYGIDRELDQSEIRFYCPNCTDVYKISLPENESQTDGAFFGPDWVHLLMKNHPEVAPEAQPEVSVPKLFGYRIFHHQQTTTSK